MRFNIIECTFSNQLIIFSIEVFIESAPTRYSVVFRVSGGTTTLTAFERKTMCQSFVWGFLCVRRRLSARCKCVSVINSAWAGGLPLRRLELLVNRYERQLNHQPCAQKSGTEESLGGVTSLTKWPISQTSPWRLTHTHWAVSRPEEQGLLPGKLETLSWDLLHGQLI